MKRAMTIKKFCSDYEIGKTKAYQEIAEGRLMSVTVGSKRLIRHDDAEAWLSNLGGPDAKSAA